MKRICVFSGSNVGNKAEYEQLAVALGNELATRQYGLVYGGSQVGLMGRLANAVLTQGGEVIGVMPRGLFRGEIVHDQLTELIEVTTMHERKAKMSELADAFIALPGGYGTFEELFEAICWSQIGIHQKPIGLLNIAGFYDPLVQMVSQAVAAEFIHPEHAKLFVVAAEPQSLIEKMLHFQRPQQVNKWRELDD